MGPAPAGDDKQLLERINYLQGALRDLQDRLNDCTDACDVWRSENAALKSQIGAIRGWLGLWRDEIPGNANGQLQNLLALNRSAEMRDV